MRGVTRVPRTCSGDMYWWVPMGRPEAVSLVTSVCRIAATPKSRTFTVPSRATRMLDGLRSRCTTGTSCAYDSTVATCAATATAQLMGRGRSSCTYRVRGTPSTSSMTRNRCSWVLSRTASYTCGTPGCWMRAVIRASRRKRRSSSSASWGVAATACGRIRFTATGRSSTAS